MSTQWVVPARAHGAGRSLRGLVPLQDAFFWDPRESRGSIDEVLDRLDVGARHLVVPCDDRLFGVLTDRGFIDSGARLEDGRRLYVLRLLRVLWSFSESSRLGFLFLQR